MRAAVLEEFGRPLEVKEVPDPVAVGGQVRVRVLAALVLPYATEVFSGARRYPLEPPVVSGCGGIGRVEALGPDATTLQVGDLVWCDPTVRSRDGGLTPDITLQGWSARGEGGARLARAVHDGPFGELMVVPTENVHPLPASADPVRWAAASIHAVPYGGLLAIGLQPGETVVVSGATGNFGSSAVAVALAMGAGRVVAPGRNRAVLDLLAARSDRVRPVVLAGDETADRDRLREAAGGAADAAIDLLPPGAPASAVRAVAFSLREGGRIALMGGVGMLGGDDLALPYPWLMRNSITVRGQWMYPREANIGMIRLIDAGLLELERERVTTFPLEQAEEAVRHAAEHGGPFDRTVLLPSA